MIPALRQRYNAAFTEERYAALLEDLATAHRWGPDFRVAETPLFLSAGAAGGLGRAAAGIVAQLATPMFRAHAANAIPAGLSVPAEPPFPHFICIDFALTADAAGRVTPQLIELQGFPTVACFQTLLARSYAKHFPAIPPEFTSYFGGLSETSYLAALRGAIVGKCDPAETVLLEITPAEQKTRIDFAATEDLLGIRPVCVTEVRKRGGRLFHQVGGREVPIRRIYNRVIFDELLRRKPAMQFSLLDDLDVEWAGHPNWYFRISKHTLPFLRGEFVPPCHLVSEIRKVPSDLENYVLKPLYSFAGLGVDISPTAEKIAAIAKPGEWLLQRKVAYAPLLATPDGPAKAEVRLILAGDGSGWPKLLNNLVRLTKGVMHGVDFNKGHMWVGASVGLFPGGAA
ncbi:MAG TPA: hypothetical protein VN775_11435 [Opitutaceae bacterium]|nr:hypothetical protein [Opitutaceae bacterium]